MEYLKIFNITSNQIEDLKTSLNKEIITNLEIMRHNVTEVLKFLKDFGVVNLINVVKFRPDLCFKDKLDLERDLTVLDKELLLFIFDNDIDDLIDFNI